MNIFSRLFKRSKAEDGNATVEFVVMVPTFLMLFVSIFELGMAMTRMTMLEHGLDVAMREVRLSTGDNVSHDDIRDLICDEAALLKGCKSSLAVEMVTIDTETWNMPQNFGVCINRGDEAAPVVRWENGAQNDVMFVRACFAVDPMFPTFGLGALLEKDNTGAMFLVATSAFSQEPK